MSCGGGHRHGSDLALLWLWCRLAAVALIRPLAWELPYAVGAALKKDREKEKKKKKSIFFLSLLKLRSVSLSAGLLLPQEQCIGAISLEAD